MRITYMQLRFQQNLVARITVLFWGKSLLQEENPGKQIYVFNSKSASVGQSLIAMKIQECEEAGYSFEKVIETVEAYIADQHTLFLFWIIWKRFAKMEDSVR